MASSISEFAKFAEIRANFTAIPVALFCVQHGKNYKPFVKFFKVHQIRKIRKKVYISK